MACVFHRGFLNVKQKETNYNMPKIALGPYDRMMKQTPWSPGFHSVS